MGYDNLITGDTNYGSVAVKQLKYKWNGDVIGVWKWE